jgi:gluconate 5-dehydrogenase
MNAQDDLARFRLDGRVALVSGGAGGIGSRLSLALARAGARVTIVDRSAERANEVAETIAAAGSEALVVLADVTTTAGADRAATETVARFGRLDIEVNAVGGLPTEAMHPAEAYTEADWDRVLDLNLRSTLLASAAAARAMIAGGRGGRVLHISSVRGQLGINKEFAAYVAAKGAINALTRQQATEWARYGITVNAIAPTFVATAQVAELLSDAAFKESLLARIPLGRIGSTDDLVGAVIFFCSDAASFVTGQILTIDGGLTATQ